MEIKSINDAMKYFQSSENISGWICVKCSINLHIKKIKKAIEELKKNSIDHQ